MRNRRREIINPCSGRNISLFSWQKFLRIGFAVFFAAAVSACSQTSQPVTSVLEQPPSTGTQAADSTNSSNISANALTDDGTSANGQSQTAFGTPTGQQSSALSSDVIAVLPLEGAPQTAMTSLSRSLKNYASNRGLNLQVNSRSGATYQVKGYFSALNDGSGTLLVYVWDVLDQSGRRVHRINGQERSGTSRSDPWLAITDNELGRVADRTAAGLKAWVDTKGS